MSSDRAVSAQHEVSDELAQLFGFDALELMLMNAPLAAVERQIAEGDDRPTVPPPPRD